MYISTWLNENGLGEFAELFAKEAITVDVLASLTDPDLVAIGIDKLGDRKRILAAIGGKSSSAPIPTSIAPIEPTKAPAPKFVRWDDLRPPKAPEDRPAPFSVQPQPAVQPEPVADGVVTQKIIDESCTAHLAGIEPPFVPIFGVFPVLKQEEYKGYGLSSFRLVLNVAGVITSIPLWRLKTYELRPDGASGTLFYVEFLSDEGERREIMFTGVWAVPHAVQAMRDERRWEVLTEVQRSLVGPSSDLLKKRFQGLSIPSVSSVPAPTAGAKPATQPGPTPAQMVARVVFAGFAVLFITCTGSLCFGGPSVEPKKSEAWNSGDQAEYKCLQRVCGSLPLEEKVACISSSGNGRCR